MFHGPNFLWPFGRLLYCYLRVDMTLVENEKAPAIFQITHFPDIDKTTEYRVAGWMLGTLKINGVKESDVKFTKFLTNFKSCTAYRLSWQTSTRHKMKMKKGGAVLRPGILTGTCFWVLCKVC